MNIAALWQPREFKRLAEVTTKPLDAIWIQPKDYREATKGTPFESEKQRPKLEYRRQAERENFIEKNIKKHRILVDE